MISRITSRIRIRVYKLQENTELLVCANRETIVKMIVWKPAVYYCFIHKKRSRKREYAVDGPSRGGVDSRRFRHSHAHGVVIGRLLSAVCAVDTFNYNICIWKHNVVCLWYVLQLPVGDTLDVITAMVCRGTGRGSGTRSRSCGCDTIRVLLLIIMIAVYTLIRIVYVPEPDPRKHQMRASTTKYVVTTTGDLSGVAGGVLPTPVSE